MSVLLSLLPKPKRELPSNTGKRDDTLAPGGTIEITQDNNRPREGSDGSLTVAAVVGGADAEGVLAKYDIIAQAGHPTGRLVQTRPSDMQPCSFSAEQLAKPTSEQLAGEMADARKAIQNILLERTAKTQPKNLTASVVAANAAGQLLKYQPKATVSCPEPAGRVVRMVNAPVDPLEPPKFHHKRIPRAPPSPPAPRLHVGGTRLDETARGMARLGNNIVLC